MGWEKVKLCDCCKSISDGDHQPPPKSEAGIPFVTISNITSTNQFDFSDAMFVPESYYEKLDEKRKAQCGDILYSVVGSFGIPVLIKQDMPFVFQRHIAILKPDNTRIDSKFLYYTMLSRDFYHKADAVAVGTAQRTVGLKSLRNMEIAVPPMTVQRRIAEILAAYDALIENNQRQIKLLEEAAHRIYREWFVKLRFPGYEKAKVVDGVPEGWRRGIVSDVCDTVGGGTPSTKVKAYYERGNIPWVTPTDITRNGSLVVLDTSTKITEDGLQHSSAKMVPAGTILMTSRASVGFFGIADFEVCTNQGFIACIPKQNNYQMYLLHNLMDRVDEIRGKSGGATYLEIRKSTFRNLEIAIPSDEVLDSFQEIAHNLLARERVLVKSNKLLQEARDRLLPKLLSGEIAI